MKKGSQILYQLFGWGAYISIFAGAACFFGFVIALIIGGGTGAALAVMIKGTFFPIIIKLTSFSVALGLIGMYFEMCIRDRPMSPLPCKRTVKYMRIPGGTI